MSEEAPKTDLCPMCTGTGQHNLKPLGGRTFSIGVYHLFVEGATNNPAIERSINEWCAAGYDVDHTQTANGIIFIFFKWRWI